MNLQQLRHLVALHETGSFSRAAEQLHLTQPALSRSIQLLEEELGVSLIDRIGKRNEFTAFGKAVLARARRVVFEAEELKRSALLLQEGLAGSLRVGMAPGAAALFMRHALKSFATGYPQIRLQIGQGSTEALLEQLRRKQLDAVVADSRAVTPSEDLVLEQLPDMAAGCLCRAGHPLLALQPITIEQLARYPVAAPHLSSEIARIFVERHGAAAHPDRLVTLRCDSVATLLQVVAETDAVCLSIYAAGLDGLARGELVRLTLAQSLEASARYGVVSLAGRTPPPALDLLRGMLVAEIERVQGELLRLPAQPARARTRRGA
ncbi:MAG TPA: LysR family transcriptional regulator [Variovorax sp.]|nr:LysR family transcriptional regulator [Variovorax sp.]